MKETRILSELVEARESEGASTIAGYAAVFDTPYEVMGFTESVSPKAFNKTLKERADLAVVWSHDADRVLGTQASGTARFSTDEHGLRYEADLDLEDPDGIGAWRKIKTGKVRQSSFSFEPIKDKWEERDGQPPHRTLLEVRLYEASPVWMGANPQTDIDVKRAAASFAEYRGADPDLIEKAMREGTLADALTEHRDDDTQESSPEPEPRSEVTPEPEPKQTFHPYV